ncbi:MAG: universal stress protein [Bacteroidetes bacterium]|nr:MAG: universal stress protein [Bacteroidota bacterium]REJ99856.1 MAG: universal stress protein [Bacteroidota bacterium]REK34229.1 MAG: universal stress protein [Bacteroidota bacterium]REK50559.1 MAG: universal stress protein [Bacteroidota bacterium]
MPPSKNHILVPIDFSEQSMIALGQSYNLARLSKADLTLIYVIEESFQLPFFSKNEDKSLEKKIQKELTKLAEETSQKAGLFVHTLIAKGKVYEEIQKAAKKLKCSFIVMGTNGSVGLKKFIGSNALRVVREAPCPVITIKGKKHRPGCKHIVLPLDLSKETKEKVRNAIEFARMFGSIVHLVSVLTTDDEFIVKKLKRQMNQVFEHIKNHDIVCTSEFIQGDDVSEEVVNFAKKMKADLIMIMTQQEMNWTDIMFISSSAQEIINGTDIPVLSIRPSKKKDTTLSVFEY